MGILYLDEAGNTGLKDRQQPLLIYGGPYVEPTAWKVLSSELKKIQHKYLGIITSRFQSGLEAENFLVEVGSNVSFLMNFHFHAKEIINRNGLWSKLDKIERFVVLEDVLDILISYRIPFYIGALDKQNYRIPKRKKQTKMHEYYYLHKHFLSFVEKHISEASHVVTVIDDGDAGEKAALKQSLNNPNLEKFFGELVYGKHKDYPILQVADVGVWVFQAYHRLTKGRNDDYAKNVRRLYNKLSIILIESRC